MTKLPAVPQTTVRLLAALTSIARAATAIVVASKSSIQTNLVPPTHNAVRVSSALEALKVKTHSALVLLMPTAPTTSAFQTFSGAAEVPVQAPAFHAKQMLTAAQPAAR